MKLKDKIRGAIVGYAFGNALGLGSEFMTGQEVETYYPDGLQRFSQIIRDAHRMQWRRGEWTNDTEMVLILLECVLEEGGYDIYALARKLKLWLATSEADLSPIIPMVCNSPGWEDHPIAVAHKVWTAKGITDATNEAIGRALVTGLVCNDRELMECTRKLVLITNDDTRCVSTAMIMARMFNSLLYRDRETDFYELREIAQAVDPRTSRFLERAHDGDIELLEIDDEDTQTWTRKAMAAALWGLWHGKDAADCIYRVIGLGGDADTNGALAGALAGIKYGYSALPEEKEKLLNLGKLLTLSDRLADLIKEKRLIAEPV